MANTKHQTDSVPRSAPWAPVKKWRQITPGAHVWHPSEGKDYIIIDLLPTNAFCLGCTGSGNLAVVGPGDIIQGSITVDANGNRQGWIQANEDGTSDAIILIGLAAGGLHCGEFVAVLDDGTEGVNTATGVYMGY